MFFARREDDSPSTAFAKARASRELHDLARRAMNPSLAARAVNEYHNLAGRYQEYEEMQAEQKNQQETARTIVEEITSVKDYFKGLLSEPSECSKLTKKVLKKIWIKGRIGPSLRKQVKKHLSRCGR
jgi:ABC-type transport system involved in cytochrome bd biosynthesis fused ATPase/permease subunit